MALKFSVAVRNGELDSIEGSIGTAPNLQIRTGSPPANCAAVNTGTLLAELVLPSDWLAAASSGAKVKAGTWSVSAVGSGTAAHFRIFDTADANCHIQGTVTVTGGGGDLTLDNVSIAAAQTVTITAFQLNAGNA